MPNTKGMDGGPIVSVAKLPAPLFALTKARFDAAHYANSANLRGGLIFRRRPVQCHGSRFAEERTILR